MLDPGGGAQEDVIHKITVFEPCLSIQVDTCIRPGQGFIHYEVECHKEQEGGEDATLSDAVFTGWVASPAPNPPPFSSGLGTGTGRVKNSGPKFLYSNVNDHTRLQFLLPKVTQPVIRIWNNNLFIQGQNCILFLLRLSLTDVRLFN